MPTLDENLQAWNRSYDWSHEGEEWSAAWGGSKSQWFGSILPRIHAFLPAHTILEIAPGFGRWTNYLRAHAERLIVVDLSQACIHACQQRFGDDPRITCHVNDGRSLDMISDHSVDFVFSFDSLVHADADVLREYLIQIARKLKPGGSGFIHHSNLGEYRRIQALTRRLPGRIRHVLTQASLVDETHYRDVTMTAPLFETYCKGAGLVCIGQELVNWGTKRSLIDCFSSFVHKASHYVRTNHVVRNRDFMRETESIRHLSTLYAWKEPVRSERES
jgi:SAM-dependent methyltransferase